MGVRARVQVITPCRRLILCADNRKEMEEWISALRSVQNRHNYEVSAPLGTNSPKSF